MVHAERGNSDLVRELLLHNAHVDLQDEVSSDYESFCGSVDDVHVCVCGEWEYLGHCSLRSRDIKIVGGFGMFLYLQ